MHSTGKEKEGTTSQVSTGAIGKRRRTNNSDEMEYQEMNSENSQDQEKSTTESVEKVSCLGPLTKVAASMNPQQYELLPEVVEPIPFPGNVINSLAFLHDKINDLLIDILSFQQSII